MKKVLSSTRVFIGNLYTKITTGIKKSPVAPVYKKSTTLMKKRPLLTFTIGLAILFIVIGVGNFLSQTPESPEVEPERKNVQIYKIGESPTVTLQAQIEKNGVIQITALTGGVVKSIPVTEGQIVKAGQTLVNLATNYNGASLPGIQTQLARTQYNNVINTYGTQKEIISKQREVAEKTNQNTDELRKINTDSLDDTRTLLNQNENLLTTVNQRIEQLESTNGDPTEIAAARQSQSQLQSGVNQLRSTVRNLEYQTNRDNPPTELANLQKDLTLKQLDIQEKALELNKDVSRLQLQIAAVSESLLYPSSPFEAVVERIHVSVGQSVAPGTVLATISCTNLKSTAVIRTPRKFALSISQIEPTVLRSGNKEHSLFPEYISTVATDGTLYSVIYSLSEEITNSLDEDTFIPLEVPIGYADTSAAVPFIPIDAVYQGQDSSYVNIAVEDTVRSREVELGSVYGKYVEVQSGLNANDMVILNRNVISGDKIIISANQ